MKKLVTFILCFEFCSLLAASRSKVECETEARNFVESVYRQLDIAKVNSANEAYLNAEKSFTSSFGIPRNQPLPNDTKFVINNEFDNTLYSSAYIVQFSSMAESDEQFSFAHRIVSVIPLEEKTLNKSENAYNFVKVMVEKTLENKTKNVRRTFIDTLEYSLGSKKIVRLYNIVRPSSIDHFSGEGSAPQYSHSDAAWFYHIGQYQLAYEAYLDVAVHSNDGDAYYRLALMTYDKDKCPVAMSKKDRMKKTMEYIQLAKKYGNYEISQYASNFEYWIL